MDVVWQSARRRECCLFGQTRYCAVSTKDFLLRVLGTRLPLNFFPGGRDGILDVYNHVQSGLLLLMCREMHTRYCPMEVCRRRANYRYMYGGAWSSSTCTLYKPYLIFTCARVRQSASVGTGQVLRLLASPPVALASQHSLLCDVLLYSTSADIRYM